MNHYQSPLYRSSKNLHPGIWTTHRTELGYRHASPNWENLLVRIKESHTNRPLPTANYSLLTAHRTHTISAKEKDAETGYSYFGSRYYNSDLSIWLSVDPMASKYPSLSPYVYCANNPVKLVDPNGDSIINPYKRLIDECNAVIMELKEGIKGQKYNSPSLAKAALATTKEELKEYIDYSQKVEIAISALKEDVDFYNTLNHIEDERHTPVDIYIYINPNLPIEKGRDGECDENHYLVFDSFCGFRNNKVGMILSGHDIGATACHEGGHIENDVKGYTTQRNWIISHGYANDPKYDGHEPGNPSGKKANQREREYKLRHSIPYNE